MNLSPLIYEDGNISLGRVAFWILFGLAIGKYWALGIDTPSGLTQALMALLLYGLGKRYIDAKSQ